MKCGKREENVATRSVNAGWRADGAFTDFWISERCCRVEFTWVSLDTAGASATSHGGLGRL